MPWFFMNKQFEQLCGILIHLQMKKINCQIYLFILTIQYSCEIELYAIWTHLRYSFIVVLSAKNHLKPIWRYFLILLKPISTYSSNICVCRKNSRRFICYRNLLPKTFNVMLFRFGYIKTCERTIHNRITKLKFSSIVFIICNEV